MNDKEFAESVVDLFEKEMAEVAEAFPSQEMFDDALARSLDGSPELAAMLEERKRARKGERPS